MDGGGERQSRGKVSVAKISFLLWIRGFRAVVLITSEYEIECNNFDNFLLCIYLSLYIHKIDNLRKLVYSNFIG